MIKIARYFFSCKSSPKAIKFIGDFFDYSFFLRNFVVSWGGKVVVGDIVLVIDLGLFQHGFLSSVRVQESAQILMRMIVDYYVTS